MNKLKVIFLAHVLCSVTGCFIFDECFATTDCGNPDEKLPAYANESGIIIEITVYDYHSYTKLIDVGDTLHSSYYFREKPEEWSIPNQWDCGIAAVKGCSNPTRMELHFLDISEKCLIFDGPIKNDEIDMRSWDSYKKGKKIDDWADFWAGREYVYTITPEHRAMAKEEYCQGSTSE